MDRDQRLARYGAVATRLALLSDNQLAALLEAVEAAAAGIGGTTGSLRVDGVPVFVKQVPLTDLERRPEHQRSTANLFRLPTFYQYGIGSAGFGAWRELAAHLMTTNWVLGNHCQNFPILYHWRVLPRAPQPTTPETLAQREAAVAHWEGSSAVRERLAALDHADHSVVLLMEHVPQTVDTWLHARVAAGGRAAASAYAMVERDLQAGAAFMNSRGLLHF
ncbi:MAG: protein kinase family protein, partial [Dehalococcoidia bacterium]